MTYNLSIETNEHSLDMGTFKNRVKAIKAAKALRYGGTWAGQLTASENPHVALHNATTDKVVYVMPLYKIALKK